MTIRDVPSYLYVIQAASGASDGEVLSLSGVKDSVIRFTDRPYHQVENVSLEELAHEWQDGIFAGSPPNAAVSWDDNGERAAAAIEITNLTYDGETLALAYNELKDADILGAMEPSPIPAELTDVSVVVDGTAGYIVMPFWICEIAAAGTPEQCTAPTADVLNAFNLTGPYPQENISGTFTDTLFTTGGIVVHDAASEALATLVFPCDGSGPSDAYTAVVSWLASTFDSATYPPVPSGEPACDPAIGVSAGWCEGTIEEKDPRNVVECIWHWTGAPTPVRTATPSPTPTPDYSTQSSAEILAEFAEVPLEQQQFCFETLLPPPVCDRASDVFAQTANDLTDLALSFDCNYEIQEAGATGFTPDRNTTKSESKTYTPSAYNEQWSCTLSETTTTDTSGAVPVKMESSASIDCVIPGTSVHVRE